MSARAQKALVRRLYAEVLSDGDVAALDQLVADDYLEHSPLPGQATGRAGLAQRVAMLRAAFPDLRYTLEAAVAEGDLVVVRWHLRGTHRGGFLGIRPGGRAVTATGIDILRIGGGRITEHRSEQDHLGLLQQLGAIPAARETET